MELNIQTLINEKRIETLMQLVISPNKDFVSGIEALSRGVHPETGELISPAILFAMARERNLLYELETLMLHKAFETFKPIYEVQNEMLLFINMSPEFIEKCLEIPIIEEAVYKYGIPASNIFFDINPFKPNQMNMIKHFTDEYKQKGFYICVDDVGVDYNNIDKILYLGPDVLKIDIRALKQLKNQQYAEKLVQTLKYITEPMGIVMVGKGIEDESDLNFTLDCGAQFMQGFFISKPLDLTLESLSDIKMRYTNLIEAHVREEDNILQLSRLMTARACNIIHGVINTIESSRKEPLKVMIDHAFEAYPMVENLWFIDDKGKQMGATWTNKEKYDIKHSSMFMLHNHGSDFSTKELFNKLYGSILETWVKQPFKSTMTNNLCVSCSKRLDWSEEKAVLCININIDESAFMPQVKAAKPISEDGEFGIVIHRVEE